MSAPARTAGPRCAGCGHKAHADQCPAKGPSRCAVALDPATGLRSAVLCGARPPCPCPYGWCHTCAQPVAGASTLPLYDGSPEINVDRGSAGDPAGLVEVWRLADGTLAARRLEAGEPLGEGRRWRGREHNCTNPAPEDRRPAGPPVCLYEEQR